MQVALNLVLIEIQAMEMGINSENYINFIFYRHFSLSTGGAT